MDKLKMNKDQAKEIFLEHCYLSSKIDGSMVNLDNVEIPLVGITGLGSEHERAGKKSVWICGEILSPFFIMNNNCHGRSHIEGIISESGEMKFLESVYDFMAHEGDCLEYGLKLSTTNITETPLNFEGDLIARLNRNSFRPVAAGKAHIALNPFWTNGDTGVYRSHSLPRYKQHIISGTYIPQFWNNFLGELEEAGYEHPYGPITEKLDKERKEKLRL